MEEEEKPHEEIKSNEIIKNNQRETEFRRETVSELNSVDKTIEELRLSGKLKDLLKRINIDENGDFLKDRKHS